MGMTRWIGAGVAVGVALSCLTVITLAWSQGSRSERYATRALAFSRDGATVYASGLTGSDEKHSGFIGAWDAGSGKPRWQAQTDGMGEVSVAPDNKRLVCVDWNGDRNADARVYDARTGKLYWQQKLVRNSPGPIYTMRAPVFSADNRRVFLVYTDGIQVLDAATGAKAAFWSSDGKNDMSIGRVIPAPNNKTLLVETHSNVYGGKNTPEDVVQLWDARDGRLIRTVAMGADTYTDFAASGKTLALVNGKRQLRVKDVVSDRNVKTGSIVAKKVTFTDARFVGLETVEVTGWKRQGDDEDFHTWTWNTRTGTVRDAATWYPGRFADTSPDGTRIVATPDTTAWTAVPASLHETRTGRKMIDLQIPAK